MINKDMQKTILEWLSIHIANKEFYARKTKEFIDQLNQENKNLRKQVNDLQVKNDELKHRLKHGIDEGL